MNKSALLLAGLASFLPVKASAHGIGEVYALPVPLEYYLLGAGLAVAFSFFITAVFLNKPYQATTREKTLSLNWLSRPISIFKGIALFLLVLSISAGVFGNQNPSFNFTPIFFWVYFIVGVGILSLFVGNIWDKLNPWKTLTDWLNAGVRSREKKISGWVGVIFLLALFWLELVSGTSFIPRIIGAVLLFYTIANIFLSRLYENWYKDGEVFSVLFGFIGTLAYWKIGDENRSLVKVSNQEKLSGQPEKVWVLGTASVLLAGTTFDSVLESIIWFSWREALGFSASPFFANTLGIVIAPLPFLAAYLLACFVMKKLVGNEYSTFNLAKRFIYSLAPIAFGYTLAHNFSLFIVIAPQMISLISDPFGLGWNLFGTASYSAVTLILGAKAVWFIEIGFVVLAHIFGVWYAHIIALNVFKEPKQALKSQYPLALLMVGFTVLTLWLLSQPLVTG